MIDEFVKYFKIGEEISLETQLNGKCLYKEILVVTEIPKPTCEGCMFADKGVGCYQLACAAGRRSDKRNVIFKRIRLEQI